MDPQALTNGDFKYELVPAGTLLAQLRDGELALWECNREVDAERVARLTASQRALLVAGKEPSLFTPAPVVLYGPGAGPSRWLLLDGQHRLKVLAGLVGEFPRLLGQPMLVCTASGPTEFEVFERVNSGTPVPALYYNRKVSGVVGEFVRRLQERYPQAVSKAAHPHRPGFNPSKVRDEMTNHVPFRDAVLDGLVTATALMELADEENSVEELVTLEGTRPRVPASVVERARKTKFHLGLRDGWPLALAAASARAAARGGAQGPEA